MVLRIWRAKMKKHFAHLALERPGTQRTATGRGRGEKEKNISVDFGLLDLLGGGSVMRRLSRKRVCANQ